MKRSSGILLSISSLPSPYGIGTLGREAYDFVDFLIKAEQRYWQVLPVGPTGYGDSPYLSFTTFGGNPYFIDLELLIEDGLLTRADVSDINWGKDSSRVDYGLLYKNRWGVFRKAYEGGFGKYSSDIEEFVNKNKEWLPEYALYMAVKNQFSMKHWLEWPDKDIRMGVPEAKKRYASHLKKEIDFHIFLQYLFFSQWNELREYANAGGVEILGDLPYYVPLDSADVWGSPENFRLDSDRVPVAVGGVPPDSFSETGQLWGNPLYDWDAMKKDGYDWWRRRIKAATVLFDGIRIDHFRGIESFWEIPGDSETAIEGRWKPGPGTELIDVMKEAGKGFLLIAEDLGYLTEGARKLQKESGFPCMKVLQFAFDNRPENEYLPHNYDRNCVAYTGTHDNDTILGWWESLPNKSRSQARKYLGLSRGEGPVSGIIRGSMASVANLFVAQMQDYLELDSQARMNIPGTGQGNWRWRLKPGQLSSDLAEKIRQCAWMYGRI